MVQLALESLALCAKFSGRLVPLESYGGMVIHIIRLRGAQIRVNFVQFVFGYVPCFLQFDWILRLYVTNEAFDLLLVEFPELSRAQLLALPASAIILLVHFVYVCECHAKRAGF